MAPPCWRHHLSSVHSTCRTCFHSYSRLGWSKKRNYGNWCGIRVYMPKVLKVTQTTASKYWMVTTGTVQKWPVSIFRLTISRTGPPIKNPSYSNAWTCFFYSLLHLQTWDTYSSWVDIWQKVLNSKSDKTLPWRTDRGEKCLLTSLLNTQETHVNWILYE